MGLVCVELPALDERADPLPRQAKNLTGLGNRVEFVGNHARHNLIVTGINRTVKYEPLVGFKLSHLNVGEPTRPAACESKVVKGPAQTSNVPAPHLSACHPRAE